MHLEIYSEDQIRTLPTAKKAELVDFIFNQLPLKFDPTLLRDIRGCCAIRLTGSLDRTFAVRIDESRIACHSITDSQPAQLDAASIAIDCDDFLVHAATCKPYAASRTMLDSILAQTPKSDAAVVRTLFFIWGELPSRVAEGLRALDGQTFPLRVDELRDLASAVQHVSQKRPFVIRKGATGWPSSKWTIASLQSRIGHLEDSTSARTLDAQIDRVKQGPAYVSIRFPEILRSDLPRFAVGSVLFTPWESFLSGAGAVAGLHRDCVDGIAAVFFGSRRFWFYAPSEAANLYVYPGKESDSQCSKVLDPRTPDLLNCPRFESAKAIEVDVAPGDLVYVPAGWFHAVLSMDLSYIVKAVSDLESTWSHGP